MPVQKLLLSKLSGVLVIKWKDYEVENEIKKLHSSRVPNFQPTNDFTRFLGSPANVDCKKRDLFPSWNDIDCQFYRSGSQSLSFIASIFFPLASEKQAQSIADKDFSTEIDAKGQGPIEFQELGQAFNDMSHNLQETFESLNESEREKGMMIAQLSHDIKTAITSIQATVEGI